MMLNLSPTLFGGILCLILFLFRSKQPFVDRGFQSGGSELRRSKIVGKNATRNDYHVVLPDSTISRPYWKPEWDEIKAIDGSDVQDFEPPKPQHLRLAFIGDSISRYQYLSLVHFVKFGHFPDPHTKHSFVYPPKAKAYDELYSYTNRRLAPLEQCDCYFEGRGEGEEKALKVENRYFYDNSTDNLIVFLLKYGEDRTKISVPPNKVDFQYHAYYSHRPEYKKANWTESIQHLAALPIKPQHVILNAGLSKHDLKDEQVQNGIAQTLAEHDMVGIYKSTTCASWETFQGAENPIPNEPLEIDELSSYEASMCEKLGHCMSTEWTCNVVKDKLLDDYHFDEPIYKRLNLQLLDILHRLKS